jgi:hypothetical protein
VSCQHLSRPARVATGQSVRRERWQSPPQGWLRLSRSPSQWSTGGRLRPQDRSDQSGFRLDIGEDAYSGLRQALARRIPPSTAPSNACESFPPDIEGTDASPPRFRAQHWESAMPLSSFYCRSTHRFPLRRVTRAHRKSRRPAGEMQIASADNNWRMISRFSSVCSRTALD